MTFFGIKGGLRKKVIYSFVNKKSSLPIAFCIKIPWEPHSFQVRTLCTLNCWKGMLNGWRVDMKPRKIGFLVIQSCKTVSTNFFLREQMLIQTLTSNKNVGSGIYFNTLIKFTMRRKTTLLCIVAKILYFIGFYLCHN